MQTELDTASAASPRPAAPAIGEVVEASTISLKAVAVERFDPPAFGAFVRVSTERRSTFAIVSHVEHASVDPTRRAIPLGRTWDELRREQPQVLELLTTEFDAVSVAYTEDGLDGMNPFLPPVPPRVHDFVYPCTDAEVHALTNDLSFVRTLASLGPAQAQAAAELIAAAIRGAAEARGDRRSFLLRAGREVADVYRQDYDQARSILRRLGMRVAGDGREHPAPDRVDMRRESEK